VIAWLWVALAFAHPLAPAGLEVDLTDGVAVTWRTPAARPAGVVLSPSLPHPCVRAGDPVVGEDEANSVLWTRQAWDCGPEGLVGRAITIDGLAEAPVDVVATVRHADGTEVRALLHGADDTLLVTPPEQAPAAFPAFLTLGVDHLLFGYDHVMFVLGLLLLVGPTRRLVVAATSFTVGHSVTLALAALDVVRVPQAPVEVAIAASLVWLAVEILADVDHPGQSWLSRHPGRLCAAIGLVHGLGFAGALAETGLPADAVLPALVGFNLGVEVGQLAVIGVAIAAWRLARPISPERLGRAVPAWVLGALAAAWVWERTLGL